MRAGSLHTVAVKQQEVGRAHHVLAGNGAAAVAGAREQTPSVALGGTHAVDEFMHARGLQDCVVVAATLHSLFTSTSTLRQPPSSSQRVASSVARTTAASSASRSSWPK